MKSTAAAWTFALAATVATAAFAETEAERFLFGSFRSAQMERAPGQLDREARAVAMEGLRQRLAAEAVAAARERPLLVEADAAAVAEVLADRSGGRYRVGVNQWVGQEMSLASLAGSDLRGVERNVAFGALRGAADGGYVWTGVVRSPGASALRLHLTAFDLPRGAELYVYNRSGQAFGPYVGRGPLGDREVWTHTVFGDEMTLQLVDRGAGADLSRARFVVAELGYLTARFTMPYRAPVRLQPESLAVTESFCGFNAACVENAGCYNLNGLGGVENAIADMLFASGAFYYICTGGLVADTDDSSQVPYFLTANHCISKGREANSLETYFHYQEGCGSTACAAPFDEDPRDPATLGATIVAANRTGDFTLLRLPSLPAGTALLGWDSAPVANANGMTLYRVSHPGGAPQAYSEHVVDTSKGTCASWPRGNWIYSRDTLGATEGGSSGSPVLNGSGQIVGQLSGACGTNVNDNCDSVSNATVDGAFAAYFSQVAPYLDPPGGCVPQTEVCDGVDNDCDGQVDEGCPACTPTGQHCTVDSDCCSGDCSNGKPSTRVCL